MAERFEIVEKALLAMLEDKKYATLRDILVTMNPTDIAGLFDGLEEKQIPLMYRLLPKELAAETFVEMEPEAQELLIRGFSDNELKEVLDELYVDDAADLVEEMPANVVKRILKQADPEMRSRINKLRFQIWKAGGVDIVVTHAPPKGLGDLEDHAHRVAHEEVGEEVGRRAELRQGVRSAELRLHDGRKRPREHRDEARHEEHAEQHGDCQSVFHRKSSQR